MMGASTETNQATGDDEMNTIVLNESGYDTGMTFEEYAEEAAKYGDDPRSYSTDIDNFAFVGWEYAQNDPSWNDGSLADWPEHLPLWMYRPQ